MRGTYPNEKNRSIGETQTLRAGCSKAEPKKFAPPLPQTPFPRAQDGHVTPSLVKIDARNFELSW